MRAKFQVVATAVLLSALCAVALAPKPSAGPVDRGAFTVTVPALWEEKAGSDGWTYRYRPADGSEISLFIEKKPSTYKDDASVRAKIDEIGAYLRQKHGADLKTDGAKLAGVDAQRHSFPGNPGRVFLLVAGAQKKLLLLSVSCSADVPACPPEAEAFVAGMQLKKERKDPLGGLLGGLDKLANDLGNISKELDKLLDPGAMTTGGREDSKKKPNPGTSPTKENDAVIKEPEVAVSQGALVVDELPVEIDSSWVRDLEKAHLGAGASLLVEGMAVASGTPSQSKGLDDLFDIPDPKGSAEEAGLLAEVAAAREIGALSIANMEDAWKEAVMAASYGDEQATREALAQVHHHLKAAKSSESKLQQVAKKAAALPAKPAPKERKAELQKDHRRMLAETLHVVAPVPQKQEWGFRLVQSLCPIPENDTPGEVTGSGTSGSYKNAWETGGTNYSIGASWQMPEVIIPGKPARVSISGFATNGSAFSAHISMGLRFATNLVIAGFRIHPNMPSNSSDSWEIVLPNFRKTLEDRKNHTKPTLMIPLRDPGRLDMIVVSHESGNNETDTVAGLPVQTIDCFQNLEYSGDDRATLTLHVRQYSGGPLAFYRYEWSPDCSADAATIDPVLLPEEKEKAESIQFHQQNIQIIQRSLSKDVAELGKESDPVRRAALEFRILQARSDMQAEKDLIASIQTGTLVHTRSPFDDYAHDRFVQSIRENQVRMEDFQRARARLPRLISLLPADRQKAAKDFVDRQMTPEMLAKMDKASLQKITEAVSNQVQGYWQGEAAKNEEKAAIANDYLTRAERVKTIADVTVAIGSFGSASALYKAAAYVGTTGYIEGGPKEAVRQASMYLNAPVHAAMEAMKAYPKDGWTGAAKAGAIGFVMSKLTTMGAGPSASGSKLTVKESMALAEFKQAQTRGKALVDDFAKVQAELDSARKAGRSIEEVHAIERQLAEKAAIVHSDIHAKAFLKYKAEGPLQSAFSRQIDGIHSQVEKRFHELMAEAKWNPQELKACRNSTSAGTVNMDFDIMLVEKQGMGFSKDGASKGIAEWQKEAQAMWEKAYKETTGRSAGHAMENLTTSGSAEAFKDLAWIGRDKSKVQSIWATQAGDVTRYKGAEIMHNSKLGAVDPTTRLYEAARGAAKDIDTKLLDRLTKASSSSGVDPARRKALVEKWTAIKDTLKDIGEGRMDPIHGNRKIRALTGGYDIPNVIDHAGILMGEFAKRFGSAKPAAAAKAGAKGAPK